MSTGYHPYLPSRAGKVQGAVQEATLTLFGPTGQTILIPGSGHHAGLTARQRMAMMLIAIEEHSSAPRPGARLDSSSQPKESGDDIAMKTTCLVLLMSGIVPLVQASNATAASSKAHAAYSAQNRQQRSSNQVQASPGAGPQTTAAASAPVTSQLSGSVSNLDFGDVNVGSSSARDVTLTNNSNDAIAISNVRVSGPGFDASGLPAGTILDAGQSVSLTVTFSPSSTGSVSGNLIVATGTANPITVINLSGTGGPSASISISIVPANQTISVGDKLQFKAVDDRGNDITASVLWSSSDPSVVSITPGGLAVAVADGPVTIVAAE